MPGTSFTDIVGELDRAIADGLGSAAAIAVGDAGRIVERAVRGRFRALPTIGDPIDEAARFDIASLTKPMATAAIAMVLVGEGRLDLAAPVRAYLPGASTAGSIAQVLGHAAGCAAHVEFFRSVRGRRALVDAAMAHPAAPPGETTIYSDLGYIQAGAVVEAAGGAPLEQLFAELVAGPLGLTSTTYGPIDPAIAVATEIDDRGLVCGRVHDENAYFGGDACGHAGLFSTVDDVARFAAAIVDALAGRAAGRFAPDVVRRFATTAPGPGSWRLGWDTPSPTPGVSHAGDRWPRAHAIGHLGFTGTSMWLDPPNRRFTILLTNRVHPTRGGTSAERIKALRRAVNDASTLLFST